MSVISLVNTVRTYLATHHMYAEDEWISGCVEYLTAEADTNLSECEIKNLAKEQWLLNDLKEICPGSLPTNLKSQHKTTLTGRFVLQINSAEDIGTPAYQQYLKLQKVNTENIEATINYEEKISSHRMIKLCLTDGVQEISAIEYKSMRNLSCDITPGCKVLIKGPVECRRGILLLTESNIELLGGEVQEIAIINSLSGLLSSKLGLPVVQDLDHNTTINQPRNTNVPPPVTQMPSALPEQPIFDQTRPVARVTSVQVANNTPNFNDDDIDLDQLAAIEAQFNDNTNKRPLDDAESRPEKKMKTETNRVDDYPDENDFLIDEDEEYLREIEAKFDAMENDVEDNSHKGPITLNSDPFVYIKQINEMNESDKAGGVFKVKGQIMKLLSKLSVGKEGWSLRCTIVDGTGEIDVDFTSDVLSKLVGYSPQEMNSLKKQMITNPDLKEKAVSALKKARDTLQVLYCIIELTVLDVPKITNLIPFEDIHVASLKRRLDSTGL